MSYTHKHSMLDTHNRSISPIKNGAVVSSACAGAQHAGVGPATTKTHWE